MLEEKAANKESILNPGINNDIIVKSNRVSKLSVNIRGDNNIIDIGDSSIARCNIRIFGNNNRIKIEPLSTIGYFELECYGNNQKIFIDEGITVFESLRISMLDNGCKLNIDKFTTFASTRLSIADDDNFIKIGRDCMFASNTMVLASDFHSIIDCDSGQRINFSTGTVIGNHIWIGNDVTILKNILIEDNSILAIGSLVNKNVAMNTIVGGTPIHVIRSNVTWVRHRLKKPI